MLKKEEATSGKYEVKTKSTELCAKKWGLLSHKSGPLILDKLVIYTEHIT